MAAAEMKSYQNLFRLLSLILQSRPLPPLSTEERIEALTLAEKNGVLSILAASEEFLSSCPEILKNALTAKLFAFVQKQTAQEYESKRVAEALKDHSIRYMLLKGSVIRRLYPKPEMRVSGDVDLLYDKNFRSEMREIMKACGFERTNADPNHDVFKKGVVKMEMHHNLTQTEPGASYYSDLWDRLEKKEGTEYAFSKEDFLVFHFYHARKHFITGEMDLRMLTDLFLMEKNWRFDRAALAEKLALLNLSGFAARMESLVDCLSGGEGAEEDEIFFRYAFLSRRDLSSSYFAYQNKKGGKIGYAASRAFPPYSYMKEKYPAVAKCPPLLPFAWLYRLLRYLFRGRKSVNTDSPDKEAVAYFETLGI